MKLVSIIIPLYNREELVKETLDSVLAQTYPHWECIIVDDGSTDHSLATAREYAARDSRFKVFQRHREPKGAPTCRNIGLEKAEGEYVIFLDSDDLLADFCLERRVEKFKQNPECDFLVFSTEEFNVTIGDKEVLLNVWTNQDPVERFLNFDVPWLIMAPIWKRLSISALNGFDEYALSWQDWELHLRAILNGMRFKFFSMVDNFLRRSLESDATIGSVSLSNAHLKSHVKLFKRLKPLIIENKNYFKRWIGLMEWIGEIAYKKNNRRIAILCFWSCFKEKYSLKMMFNIIAVICNRKIYTDSRYIPDFGSMRKVKKQHSPNIIH